MKIFKIGWVLFGIAVIIGQLTIVDYSNLKWSNNAGSYLGILSMAIIITLISSNQSGKPK